MIKVSLEKKRIEKIIKKQDKRQAEFAFSSTQAIEKAKTGELRIILIVW